MAHYPNLVTQPLNHLPFISRVEGLLQQLFFSFFPSSYEGVHFSHSLKHHLKFQQLENLMETKRNKFEECAH
jgi:hypothetical protein